ncbi:MAG TPA: hypothetical protein EYG90_02300 [Campylobacterales bacterium]|nr:hypothetical protein [Campylobacterales bacterium]
MIRYIITLIFLFSLTSFAQESLTSSTDIKTLIEKIKNARNSEKRVLMNQLKVELRQMNQNTRSRAMQELRSSFNRGERLQQGRQFKYNVNHRPHRQHHRHNGQQGGKR